MRAQQIMSPQPAVCTPDETLQFVAERMLEYDCGEIPVVRDRESMVPIGVLTDRDITCRAVARGLNPAETTAAHCMSSPCVTVELHDKIEDCCRILEERQLRRLLVVDRAGRLCGIIAQADIAEFGRPEQTAEVVRAVSQHSGATAVLSN